MTQLLRTAGCRQLEARSVRHMGSSIPGRWWLCTVILLALSCRIPSSHAFSNILLSKSNCWTELSVEEVIMNNKVVSAADSDDPHMHIQLAPSTTTDETYRWVASETGDKVEILTDLPIDIPLRVVTTNEDTDPDYQYAMDVTNERGTFANGGACEGKKRVSARSSDVVVVTITQSGAILVAAWAAGHEAVRLTPPLTFVVVSSSEEKVQNPKTGSDHAAAPKDAESNQEHENESDENVDPQKALDQAARLHDLQEQVQVHHQNMIDKKQTAKRDRLHDERTPDHDRIHSVQNPDEAAHNLALEQAMRNRHRDGTIGKAPSSTLRKSSFHKNRLLHYDIGFHHHGGLVSVYSYIKGACFLLMVSGVAVYTLRFCSRQPTNKGRREL
jgi:hypothetical protein